MLQKNAVQPRLLELLNYLMTQESLSGLNLVGGTALALYEGHRLSVDIDLFGDVELNYDIINTILSQFGEVKLISKSPKILIFSVDNIKVDFVSYNYQLLEYVNVYEGIRLVSKKDIAAMKLNAIAGRGSKKDFIDFFQLLNDFDLQQMIGFYLKKYPNGSEFLVLKSLLYFDDADIEPNPIFIKAYDWELVKKEVINVVRNY